LSGRQGLFLAIATSRLAIAVAWKWRLALTAGVTIAVQTDDLKYREALGPDTFGRLAGLNLQVTFSVEHVHSAGLHDGVMKT